MLGQINDLEHQQRRPLISAVVVHKTDDWLPGTGFWDFAKALGINAGTSDVEREAFWAREFSKCLPSGRIAFSTRVGLAVTWRRLRTSR